MLNERERPTQKILFFPDWFLHFCLPIRIDFVASRPGVLCLGWLQLMLAFRQYRRPVKGLRFLGLATVASAP